MKFSGVVMGRNVVADQARWREWAREAGVLAAGAAVYFGGRLIVEGSRTRALDNAERIMDLESALGIDIERWVQEQAVDSGLLRAVGNFSYVWFHWPLLLVVLGLLFRREPSVYKRLRNALFLSGAIGLLLFAAFPEAPPRFFDDYVGTVSDDARRHYLPYPLSWTNPYAAFPSFHVGWTLVACLAVTSTLRQPWRPLLVVPAGLVAVAVVSTGNHYVVDAVAGTAIALGAYRLMDRRDEPSGSTGAL